MKVLLSSFLPLLAVVLPIAGCGAPSESTEAASSSELVTGASVVLFGDAREFNQAVWAFDGASWSSKPPATRSPDPTLKDAAMASRGRSVVLFGGIKVDTFTTRLTGRETGMLTPETLEWDGQDWTVKASTGPSPRRHHAMATLGDKVLLFGGESGGSRLGDTWEWDGTEWTLKATTGPSPRSGHAMAALNGKIVLFGGDHASGFPDSGETWEWDGTSWTQRESPSPAPGGRFHPAMATLNGKVVVFGGMRSEEWCNRFGLCTWGERHLADTWEWDGTDWARRDTAGPSARTTAMATLGDKIVLFGGGNRADTWLWDGSAWTETRVSGPAFHNRHALAVLSTQ